jgi:surface antigen
MEGDKYWYSGNPFYQSGYGLPNCPCYAWGRFWEISDHCDDNVKNYSSKPSLPLGNAEDWFLSATNYERGQIPKLGAVICWAGGEYGHVAIVEEIKDNGDIVVSQSAWEGQYFWTDTAKKSNNYSLYGYTCQGFIYNPDVHEIIINPDVPNKKKNKRFKFVLFNRRKIYG